MSHFDSQDCRYWILYWEDQDGETIDVEMFDVVLVLLVMSFDVIPIRQKKVNNNNSKNKIFKKIKIFFYILENLKIVTFWKFWELKYLKKNFFKIEMCKNFSEIFQT